MQPLPEDLLSVERHARHMPPCGACSACSALFVRIVTRGKKKEKMTGKRHHESRTMAFLFTRNRPNFQLGAVSARMGLYRALRAAQSTTTAVKRAR